MLDVAVLAIASSLLGIRRQGALFVTTNSLGTLAATGVFHDALALTLKRLPFIARLCSDIGPTMGFRGMPFNVAQTLKNYNVSHTVSDRATTGTYAKQAGIDALANQSFTLNKWPYISFSFTLTELNQIVDSATNADARPVIIDKIMTKAFNAMAINIVTDFLAEITAAKFPTNTQVMAAATADHKKLGATVDVMLGTDTLMQAPDAILSIATFRALANGLTAIANNTYNAGDIIRTGVLNEGVSGAASVTRYNLTMPGDAANGVLFDPMAMLFANRVPIEEELPGSGIYREIITDPATGFSVMIREAQDPMTGEVTRTLTTLYGFAPGLEKHLVRIIES
ncbi:MAG: hypothetical protein ABMA13_22160 [Chthoniobacteraceae bacterium]